jgi:hypothetical protein
MASDLLEYRLELLIDSTWVDLADPATRPAGTLGRLREHPTPSLTAGQQNETGDAQAAKFMCQLDNRDGALTPHRVMSPWSPFIEAKPQTRFSVRGAASMLALTGSGSRATTPDNAGLHVARPFLAVELAPPILLPPAGSNVVYGVTGRWNATGNQRSFLLFWGSTGRPGIAWSEDGTAANQWDVTGLKVLPIPVAGGLTVAVLLDPDNGAGGADVTFWTGHRLADIAADPDAHVLEDIAIPSFTSNVHAGTAPFDVGHVTGSDGDPDIIPYPGLARRVQLREAAMAGTLAADLDVTALADTATGVTDGAGRVWSFTNAPLTKWRTVRTLRADQILPRPHPVDGLQVADLTASGVTRRLGQGSSGLQSTLRRRIGSAELAGNIKGYWPGEDGSGSTQLASALAGGRAGKVFGSIQFASDDTLAGSKPVPSVGGNTAMGWTVPIPVFSGDWRIDHAARCTFGGSFTQVYDVKGTGTVREWIIDQSNTTLRVRGYDAAGTEVVNSTTGITPVSTFAIVSLDISQDGGNIDWVVEWGEVGSNGFNSFTGTLAGTIGRPTSVGNLLTTPASGMSFAHTVVSQGLGSGWLNVPLGVADGFRLEHAGRRLLRLAAEDGVPMRVVGDPDDTLLLGPQRADLDLLGQFRECALTDGGILTEDPYTPGYVYIPLRRLINQTPRIVIDLNTPGPLTPEPADDDYGLRNLIEARRPSGSSAVATTNPAPAAADTYRDEPSVNVPSDLHLPNQAGWRVHVGSWPEMRYPKVEYWAITPAQVEQLLEVGPGDLARLTGLPADMPATTVDQLVLGDRVQAESTPWKATYNMTPAGPYEVGVWDNPDLGRWDTSGSELAASVNVGVATSMSVATTLGDLWTTAAGHLPIDLWVGGARVRATAISGASSPQTFTIQAQSLNGVVKTMPAGTKVRLWRPSIWLL